MRIGQLMSPQPRPQSPNPRICLCQDAADAARMLQPRLEKSIIEEVEAFVDGGRRVWGRGFMAAC